MIRCNQHLTWMDIERFAASRGKDWTYIIFGRVGPTGKTYLCNQLRNKGYNAIELTEDICQFVECRDEKNHCLIYEQNKCAVIILNQPLPESIYPGKKNENRNPGDFTLNDWLEVKQYEKRADAEKIVDEMKRLAKWYGCVTRADYLNLVNITAAPRDHEYGWVEHALKKVRIVPGPFGWFIEFPRAVPLVLKGE